MNSRLFDIVFTVIIFGLMCLMIGVRLGQHTTFSDIQAACSQRRASPDGDVITLAVSSHCKNALRVQ